MFNTSHGVFVETKHENQEIRHVLVYVEHTSRFLIITAMKHCVQGFYDLIS